MEENEEYKLPIKDKSRDKISKGDFMEDNDKSYIKRKSRDKISKGDFNYTRYAKRYSGMNDYPNMQSEYGMGEEYGKRNLSIERILQIQFEKALKKGYAQNFERESQCDLDNQLNKDEKCIIKINTDDNSSYHLTNKRIILESKNVTEITLYDELKDVHWVTKNFKERFNLRKFFPNRVILTKKDNKEILLENLGDSYYPFISSIENIINKK